MPIRPYSVLLDIKDREKEPCHNNKGSAGHGAGAPALPI